MTAVLTENIPARMRNKAVFKIEAQYFDFCILSCLLLGQDLRGVFPIVAVNLVFGLEIAHPVWISNGKWVSLK